MKLLWLKIFKYLSYLLPIIWMIIGGLIINPVTDTLGIHKHITNEMLKTVIVFLIFIIPIFISFMIIDYLIKKTEMAEFGEFERRVKKRDKKWTQNFVRKFWEKYFHSRMDER